MSKLEDQFEITLGEMINLRMAARGYSANLLGSLKQLEGILEDLWDEYEEEIKAAGES